MNRLHADTPLTIDTTTVVPIVKTSSQKEGTGRCGGYFTWSKEPVGLLVIKDRQAELFLLREKGENWDFVTLSEQVPEIRQWLP